MNTRIIVACHKEDIHANSLPYMPLHVGKSLASFEMGFLGDDTGDNISKKNTSYCELTGIYWAWKNLKDIDIIGLCHYRRYFDFHSQCKCFVPDQRFCTSKFDSVDLSIPDYVLNQVDTGAMVVSRATHLDCSVRQDYCLKHISNDYRVLRQVIEQTQNQQCINAFYDVFYRSNLIRPANMFIMNWHDFDEYCSWLFDILAKVEESTNIEDYDPVQKRIYGYMAERLLNVWIAYKKMPLIEKPVIYFNDKNVPERNPLKYYIRSKILDFANMLSKPHNITDRL